MLNHLLVPALRLQVPVRQPDVLADLGALISLAPPQPPYFPVNIEDDQHSDFSRLRTFLLSRHMQDLKDITNSDFYERYRRQKLAAVTKEVSLLSLSDRRLI